MKDEKIEAVTNWLEPKLVQDSQVFINFAISIDIPFEASVG